MQNKKPWDSLKIPFNKEYQLFYHILSWYVKNWESKL